MHKNHDVIDTMATTESQRPCSVLLLQAASVAPSSVAAAEKAPQCGAFGLQLLQVLLRLLPLPLPVAAACV